MVGNILFEWVCMNTVWPDEGPAHSIATLEDELALLERDFGEGVFVRRPANLAKELAGRVTQKVSLLF